MAIASGTSRHVSSIGDATNPDHTMTVNAEGSGQVQLQSGVAELIRELLTEQRRTNVLLSFIAGNPLIDDDPREDL